MLPLQLQLPSKEHLKVSFTENYVLKFRCWFRKLCNFHMLKTSGLPEYLFDLIPQNNHLQNTHFLEDVTLFYSRTDAFKYSFSPSTILEWNKLERKIRQSSTLLTFRNSLLKIGRPVPKPVYNIHNPNSLKLLTRLRLGLSHLNEHKFNHNFKDCVNPLCSCSLEVESVSHFFLHCHYFTVIRKTLFHELQSVDKNILNQSDNEIAELLFYGSAKFKLQQNCSILRPSIKLTIKSERFSGSIVQ